MNHWSGMGRICNDPDISTSQSGTQIARFRFAVNRQRKQDGQQEADFLNCVAFGKNAEFAQKYLIKGMKIVIEGHIQTGSYEKDGVKHYTTDIIVERCHFCESKNASTKAEEQPLPHSDVNGYVEVDEELPF